MELSQEKLREKRIKDELDKLAFAKKRKKTST